MKLIMNKKIIIGFLMLILCLSRFLFLDSEIRVPFGDFASKIDELYYTIYGFNLYHHGTWLIEPKMDALVSYLPVALFQNVLAFFSLKAFGNNYWGLRIPSALSSVILIILLYIVLKKHNGIKINRPIINNKEIALFITLIFIILHYQFLAFSRLQIHSIFNSLCVVAGVYMFSLRDKYNSKQPMWLSFSLGFLAVFIVLYVYLYNMYFFAACFFSLILFPQKYYGTYKNLISHILMFILGCIISLLLFELFSRFVFKTTIADFINSLTSFNSFVGRVKISSDDSFLLYIVKNLKYTFVVSIKYLVPYSYPLLFLFLLLLPVSIYKILKEKKSIDIIIFFCFVSLFGQTFIDHSNSQLRLIAILPLLLIFLNLNIFYFSFFKQMLFKKKKYISLYKFYIFGVFLLSILFTNFYSKDFLSFFDEKIVKIINYSLILIFTIVFFKILNNKFISKKYIIAIAIFCCLIQAFLSCKYIFVQRSYNYKNIMVDISNKINNKTLFGGWAYGFRLYNSSIPIGNLYLYAYNPTTQLEYNQLFLKYFNEGLAQYYIDYYIDYYKNENKSEKNQNTIGAHNYQNITNRKFDFKLVYLSEYIFTGRRIVLYERIKKEN